MIWTPDSSNKGELAMSMSYTALLYVTIKMISVASTK